MRPASDLRKLKSAFDNRLMKIRRTFGIALSLSVTSRDADPYFAAAVIELDNLILGTMRVFMISSLRNARTASGGKIRTSLVFGSEGEIAAYVMSILHPIRYQNRGKPKHLHKSDEVVIRDPRDIESVLLSCGSSNTSAWQTAISLNSNLFMDLCTVRNFYAHRNKDTWQKVKTKAQQRGCFYVKHPSEFVSSRLSGRTVTQFEDWLDDAELFFDVGTA